METTSPGTPQRNSVLHKILQGLHHVERAWDTVATGFEQGRRGPSMRLGGRPDTWVDIEWQEEGHVVFLAFKVKSHVVYGPPILRQVILCIMTAHHVELTVLIHQVFLVMAYAQVRCAGQGTTTPCK